MSIKYAANTDPYIDPVSGVLKNKLGITDQKTLDEAEATLVAFRTFELREAPLTGQFDLEHLKTIHGYLFQDVYEWAGQVRTIDLTKDTSRFANHFYIEQSAKSVFASLALEKNLQGISEASFAARSAYYLSEVNALHPFREGNGRAQREFINHIAYLSGQTIAWEKASPENILSSTIQSFHGDLKNLTVLIASNLERKPK